MKKRKIAVFIDWFTPAYKGGGPIRSVENLIFYLHRDFDIYVITGNKDHGEKQPLPGIRSDIWIEKETHKVIYLTENKQNLSFYKRLLREISPGKVYINGFFSFRFSVLPLLAARSLFSADKIILAPRGMLKPGALQIKSFKKKLFISVAKLTGLYSGIKWQATDNEEVEEIKQIFGKEEKIYLLPNLIKVRQRRVTKPEFPPLKLIFVSRIVRNKNLDFVLRVLRQINTDEEIIFTIVGTIEDDLYWQECEKLIENLPENIRVKHFKGLPNDEVFKLLSEHHYFILPTKHENFGHIIFEALNAACPVIISRNTPWRGLAEKQAGWDLPLDEKKFAQVIENCLQTPREKYLRMSDSAYNMAVKTAKNSGMVEKYKKMFGK